MCCLVILVLMVDGDIGELGYSHTPVAILACLGRCGSMTGSVLQWDSDPLPHSAVFVPSMLPDAELLILYPC